MKAIAYAVSILVAAGCQAFAATPVKTPVNGAQIAQTVCIECHAVGDDSAKQSANAQAPRFLDVAAMPSTTELSLKVFLRSSHKNMPNLLLDEQEIDALASYILGLRQK